MTVADAIGKDDVVFAVVQKLAGPKKVTGEKRREEVVSAAGGTVHDEDGVGDFAVVVFDGLADGDIMDVQFGKVGLAALKGEVFDLEISFGLVGVGPGGGLLCVCDGSESE